MSIVDLTLALSSRSFRSPETSSTLCSCLHAAADSGLPSHLSFVSGVRRRCRRAATSFDRKIASSLLLLDFPAASIPLLSMKKLRSLLHSPLPVPAGTANPGAARNRYSRSICFPFRIFDESVNEGYFLALHKRRGIGGSRMFEGLIHRVLVGFLGRYVKNFQKDQLKFSLWKEEVLLENVDLIPEAFDYLQLPFALKLGRVGRLSIRISWKNLGWDHPIIIVLEDVFICASQRDDHEWSMEAVEKREFAGKKAKLAAAELAKLSRRVSGKLFDTFMFFFFGNSCSCMQRGYLTYAADFFESNKSLKSFKSREKSADVSG
ncbi:hypothetical protein JCGZ_02744 [Jatropha curcas]|uniref:Chorein N-terminal domain-containing protein n=1 Tax=Jatropha curcas TaxID=180498 RepID=A0A067L6P4_JATCU|nr:hypothetical protein JCGZ_02744 [Jatropha curcas]